MSKVFIVAEAGVNHNGSLEIAKRLIDAAKESGADAIKFQSFKTERIISRFAPKAEYQKKTTGIDESQLEMVRKLEIDFEGHVYLKKHCDESGIAFLSSPFDIESIDLLNSIGVDILKIPSGEITNLPYLRKIGHLHKKVMLSTGMADLNEIENSLRVLTSCGTPLENITVLHCNTEYPTPVEDVNMKAMVTIRNHFNVEVGYSDHTSGIEVSVAAVSLGASVIEKHFTLSREMPGPDHKASLEPEQLKEMVRAIRNIERALGDGIKKPSPSEYRNIPIVRKSIVAARYIEEGELLNEGNIAAKRPGTGMSPMEWDKVIGRRAKRAFQTDELIEI